MAEYPKSSEELIAEIARLRLQVDNLEKSQAKLREAEQKFIQDKAVFALLEKNVDDVMWTMDADFRFTYVSPSAKLLMGYEIDEILKFSLKDILTPASWQFAIDAYLSGQKSYTKVSPQIRTLELDQSSTLKSSWLFNAMKAEKLQDFRESRGIFRPGKRPKK